MPDPTAPESAPAEGQGARTPRKPKRAVVVIHGMGNQFPMETLRKFVEAVWTRAPRQDPKKALTWSKRDFVSHSFETRRITTNEDASGKRTDFYEFYWAHMMEDTQLPEVIVWFKRLFFRSTNRVPPAVKVPWAAGRVGIAALVLVLAALAWLGLVVFRQAHHSIVSAGLWLFLAVAVLGALWYLKRRILVEVVGDAARYLTPAPQNVAARSRIRTAGLELLKVLNAREDYDRIILVCHSLGTVVGYDLLSLFWSDVNKEIRHDPANKSEALQAIEEAGAQILARPDDPDALATFRDAQKGYFDEIGRVARGVWKVTDFVTLGSPLAHAHFLLVDDGQPLLESEADAIEALWLKSWWKLDKATERVAALFRARAAQRELPLCPPLTERGHAFTYDPKIGGPVVPHHAAPFAATRWTNIYAPRQNLLWGDVIGGPVAPLFGAGVKDVALHGEAGRSFVAHVRYWELGHGDHEHLEALCAALNLFDQSDGEAWARPNSGAAQRLYRAALSDPRSPRARRRHAVADRGRVGPVGTGVDAGPYRVTGHDSACRGAHRTRGTGR